MVTNTTIAINSETKKRLENIKIHPRETFDDVLMRLLDLYSKRKR